jgi:O-antigen/teichoic acid export membrane protein
VSRRIPIYDRPQSEETLVHEETRKSLGSALWSAVDASAGPVAALLIAAGLIRALGVKEYGIMVLALAVSSLSTAVNPAVTTSTTKFISEAAGSDPELRDVGRIVASSLLAVLGIDALLIALTGSFAGPLSRLIFGPSLAGRRDAPLILLLAVTSICVQQIDSVFAATLRGLERFRREASVEACVRFALVAAVVTTGWRTRNVSAALGAYCAVFVCSSVVRATAVRLCLGGQKLLHRPRKQDFSKLINFGVWMWLNAIATIAYSSADRIVVARDVGLTAVAMYSVYVQVAQLTHFIPSSLFSFTYPVFSRMATAPRALLAPIRILYVRYLTAAVLTGLTIGTTIVLVRHRLIAAIGGNAFHAHSYATLMILVFGFALLSVNVVPYCLNLGMGRAKSVSLVTSTSMLVSVALTVVLTPWLGLNGAALARLAYGIGALILLHHAYRAVWPK